MIPFNPGDGWGFGSKKRPMIPFNPGDGWGFGSKIGTSSGDGGFLPWGYADGTGSGFGIGNGEGDGFGCGYGTLRGNGRGERNASGDSSEKHDGGGVEPFSLVSADGTGHGHRGVVTGDGIGYS